MTLPHHSHSLIVIAGPPCSGKSTLAAELSRPRGWVHLAVDRMRVMLFPDGSQSELERDAAYRALHSAAVECLSAAQTAVLDATYGPEKHRRAVERLAETTQAPLRLIECRVTPELALERFTDREADHPAVDLDRARVATLTRTYPYSAAGLVVDTGNALDACVRQVESYLASGASLRLDGSWSRSAAGHWR